MNRNINDYLTNDNIKGDFAEFCIYDYYESLGYPVHIVKTKNNKSETVQRLLWNNNIIVPDLLIEAGCDELFFIEAKSFWRYYYSDYNYKTYRIEKRKLNSCLSFYNKVFPRKRMEGYSNVYVGFCDCAYDNFMDGDIYVYLVPFEKLVDIDWFQEGKYVHWGRKDIETQSVKKIKISFKYSRSNQCFSSKFTNNILERNRSTIFVTKESIDELIERWENQTWSWS